MGGSIVAADLSKHSHVTLSALVKFLIELNQKGDPSMQPVQTSY